MSGRPATCSSFLCKDRPQTDLVVSFTDHEGFSEASHQSQRIGESIAGTLEDLEARNPPRSYTDYENTRSAPKWEIAYTFTQKAADKLPWAVHTDCVLCVCCVQMGTK